MTKDFSAEIRANVGHFFYEHEKEPVTWVELREAGRFIRYGIQQARSEDGGREYTCMKASDAQIPGSLRAFVSIERDAEGVVSFFYEFPALASLLFARACVPAEFFELFDKD